MLTAALAVIPRDGSTLLDSASALAAGYRNLANWLRDAEAKRRTNCNKNALGDPRVTLSGQLDHLHKLSAQAAASDLRVVYTKAGTRLSAAVIEDRSSVIDHKAYWCAARSAEEARYLSAVINGTIVLRSVVADQPHGQRDPRDFDKLVWPLPVPDFDPTDMLHRDVAAAAIRAQEVAEATQLPDAHFTARRRAIRSALAADGITEKIEVLVAALLA